MTGEFQYAVDAMFGGVPTTRIVPVHGSRAEPPPNQRLRLGEALVAGGVITPAQLDHALQIQEGIRPRRRLGSVVVDLGLATDVDVARGLASILGFEYVEPDTADVPVEVVRRVPRLTAEMLCVVPLGAGESWLRVAVADPTDRYTLEALRETTGLLNISLAVATPRAIETALHRFWDPDYAAAAMPAPAPAPAAAAEPQPVTEAAPPEPAQTGWEYALVGDGLPSTHPGYAVDIGATERELTRLGTLGWEAVGVSSNGTRMTVLLKRARG